MTDSPGKRTIPLERFRTALASPRADKRIDALISSNTAEADVQALAVTDLYFLISEVGLGDSIELLSLCSNEQIQGCVDMEIWDRDKPEMDLFLPWLAAMQENGFEFLGRVWEGLDPELTSLTLASYCQIYDKTLEEEVPDEEERDYFETPDTFFQIVITTDDSVQAKLVHSIIEDLYRADMQQARHTIMSARSEPVAELQEMCYRWRSGRMADLGYVDFYDALEVFRPIDPASVKIGEQSSEHRHASRIDSEAAASHILPTPMLNPLVGRGFLARALSSIEEQDEVERLQESLIFLVNRVMAAARLSPGHVEALELATLHATATVALGLEYVSEGRDEEAVRALQSISLSRLHRLGFTLCLRLSRFARMVAGRALCAGEPTLSILEAVLAKRPFFPMVLEDPSRSDVRPIETRSDLAKIADHLKALALRIAIADTLGVDTHAMSAQPEPRPNLDDYVRTALLRSCLGLEFSCAPLSSSELAAFRDNFSGAKLDTEVRTRSAHELVALLDKAGVTEARDALLALTDAWLNELEASFAELAREVPVDTRFLEGLVLEGLMA